jgi:hypothetical protein
VLTNAQTVPMFEAVAGWLFHVSVISKAQIQTEIRTS